VVIGVAEDAGPFAESEVRGDDDGGVLEGPADEIDNVVEAAADAASGNPDGEMGLAGSVPADQHGVALLGDESAGGVDPGWVS